LIKKGFDRVNLSDVRKDETFVRQMHVLYFPIEEELTELLLRFFPDILSKEVLLEGYGLDSYGKKSFSVMCMERRGLPYL
jgi:hypothetical protein